MSEQEDRNVSIFSKHKSQRVTLVLKWSFSQTYEYIVGKIPQVPPITMFLNQHSTNGKIRRICFSTGLNKWVEEVDNWFHRLKHVVNVQKHFDRQESN